MMKDLIDLIEQTIRSELTDITVEAIEIEPDIDSDGDEVLRVRVVLSKDGEFDVEHAKGLVRHIRAKVMAAALDYKFPLVSFLSQAEHKRLKTATG